MEGGREALPLPFALRLCLCLSLICLDLGLCKDCAGLLYNSFSFFFFSPQNGHSANPCMQTRDSPDPAGRRSLDGKLTFSSDRFLLRYSSS